MSAGFKEKSLYWLGLLGLPFYALIHLLPRDKKLWVFGSSFGRRFADNPRYLYLYLSMPSRGKAETAPGPITAQPSVIPPSSLRRQGDKMHGITPVWISGDKRIVRFLSSKGLSAFYQKSAAGRFAALKAGVYIYDNYSKDINFWLSGGALKVNLWHGVGNKRINHDNIHDKVRHPKNLWERFKTFPRRISDEKPTDYILCTSKEMGKYFKKAFRVLPGHVLCEGYPRCDALFDEELLKILLPAEKKLLSKIKSRNAGRMIAYLPTFRESENLFFETVDLIKLEEFLKERDYLLVIKPHPKSFITERLMQFQSEHILTAGPDIDVCTFLGRADMLITDYSSAYTDYMLLDRPVIAFTYDEDEYLKNSRDYFIDQREYMPERIAKDMDSLLEQIDKAFENDICHEARMLARKRMFDRPDGNACARVSSRIYDLAFGVRK